MLKRVFIKMAVEKHGNKFDYSKLPECFSYHNDKVQIECNIHGDLVVNPRTHLRTKFGCKLCASTNAIVSQYDSNISFINKANNKFNNKFTYDETTYNDYKVNIICPLHGSFSSSMKRHLHSVHGCKKCAINNVSNVNIRYKNMDVVLTNCHEVHGEYSYDFSNCKVLSDKITIYCKKHGPFIMSLRSHLIEKRKCHKCHYDNHSLSFKTFVDKANLIHNYDYTYYENTYTIGNNKTKIKHNKCGKTFYQLARKHLEKQGCPYCISSKGESLLVAIFIKNKIEYKRQYSISTDTQHRYDFYLPKYNTLIEYDGEQHYMPIAAWGGIPRYNQQVVNDKYKNKLATDNKIKLIRVPYFIPYAKLELYLLKRIKRYL